MCEGAVAQTKFETLLPKPQTNLPHDHRHRTTQLAEAIEQRRTDVQLYHLTLERSSHHPLPQSLEAVHLRLHQTAPVVAAPLIPNPSAQPLAINN